jgi:hypothetical protein
MRQTELVSEIINSIAESENGKDTEETPVDTIIEDEQKQVVLEDEEVENTAERKNRQEQLENRKPKN